ncbi:12851_t:CDS:2 [Funneliformis caledonium]|uniref:12851_t:CDS:1 n=1 Tax=Funneliformis caledonium TaxID=1117310 RepID=A0A9N9D5Y1_9GLOM|nr:12851_t:CDS:2 [Funneliformis caledonium]
MYSTKKPSGVDSTSENEESPTIDDKSNQTSEDETNFQIKDDDQEFYWSEINENNMDLLSDDKLIKKIENEIYKIELLASLK